MMKQGQYISIHIISVLILLFSLSGCVDNIFHVDDIRGVETWKRNKYNVYFTSRMENSIITRTLTPFPINCKAQIYVYSSQGDEQFMSSPVYRSQSAGTLTPTSGTPLLLTTGIYDFVGISSKTDDTPPSFDDNIATGLSNGTDYLWCLIQNQVIDSDGTTIPITFNHVASQIVVNLVNEDNEDEATNFYSVSMDLPLITNDVSWSLKDGVIASATTNSGELSTINMNNAGTQASYIIVPYNPSTGYMQFNAQVEQMETVSSCSVNIPAPSGGFLGGHCYEYDLIFDADSLFIGIVKVAPWKEIDVSDDVIATY